jgi:lysine-N-methylase
LLRAAWRFARGRGQIPAVNGAIGSTTFEQVEGMTGKLSEAAEETLERYYRVKVESLQFCGPLNFGLPFWDGLEALAATFPAILWWGRALGSEQAIPRAMALVDDHFGFNRVLGSRRIRFALRTLARRGELARLIAWYSR